MIVTIARDFTARLDEPLDVKAFKVRADHPEASLQRVRDAVPGIVRFENAKQAYVTVEGLRQLAGAPGDAAWWESVQGMIAYARTKGWIAENPLSIAAHVEWSD